MIISIDRTSNFCGLNYNNLQLPAMQKYLRSQGCTITFIGTERVSIANYKGLTFNSHFSNQIKKIELLAEQEKNKPKVHLSAKPKTFGEEAGFNAFFISSLFLAAACIAASIMFSAPLLIAFAIVFSTTSIVLAGMYFMSHDDNDTPIQKENSTSTNRADDLFANTNELNDSINCSYMQENSFESSLFSPIECPDKFFNVDIEHLKRELKSTSRNWDLLIEEYQQEMCHLNHQSLINSINQSNQDFKIGFFRTEERINSFPKGIIDIQNDGSIIFSFK